MILPTTNEMIVLALRLIFVLSLYALLIWVAISVRRGIVGTNAANAPGDRPTRLVVITSPRGVPALNVTFDLSDVTAIGRAAGNSIVLADTAVSAQHARLLWEQKQWSISDVGSTNGTLVNGKLVTSPTPLRIGDSIGIGPIVLRLSE